MRILQHADFREAAPPLSQLYVDRWYDKSTRNWIITLKDRQGNSWGDSVVVYDGTEARQIKKDHPGFNLPTGAPNKYDVQFPPGLEEPCRALARKIQNSPPNSFTVWNAQTKKRMFVIREATSATLVSTIGAGNQRGTCGIIPLVRWMKARLVRVARGQQEVTFRELLKG